METSFFENRTAKYVLAIYKHGNITKAANELFISQSALSKFLINTEKQLGFQLFNRFGHQMVPTHEGERVLTYAKEMETLSVQLSEEINNINNKIGGHLRCAVPIFRSSCILPRIIPDFIALHPSVEVAIIEEHCRNAEQLLLDYQANIAITTYQAKSPNIEQRLIRQNHIFIGLPIDHPSVKKFGGSKTNPAVVNIAEFQSESFILPSPGQHLRNCADAIFLAAGITPKVSLTTSSTTAAMELAAQGCGVCFLTDIYSEFQTRFPLHIFRLENVTPATNTFLIYRKNTYQPHYFIDFINIILHRLR